MNFNPNNALNVARNQYRNQTNNNPPPPTPAPAPTPSVASGGSTGTGTPTMTAPNYGTNTPIRASDFNNGWRHGENGDWVNVNAPQGSQYHGQEQMSAWQRQNAGNTGNIGTNTPTPPVVPPTPTPPSVLPQNDWLGEFNNIQKQNQDFARQQAEMQRQQQEAWQKRQEEMNRNMARMQAEQANFLTDRQTFERMTGYAGKNEQEKQVVDNYWNNNQPAKAKNVSDYYRDIKNGVVIPTHEQNRPEYAQAQAVMMKMNKYKSMTSGQLANLFKTGEMTSGDLALLSAENPDLAHAVAFTNSLNNAGKVDFETDQMRMSDEIIKNWYTDLQNDERKSLLSNALSNDVNIHNAMEDTKRKADKLAELQKSVLTIDEEVDKELEGKNASRSYAQTLKAKRGSTIHTAIASAQIDYSNAMNYQRDLIENKKYDIDYQRQLENRKFQVGNQIFMGRENVALGLQKAQAEFEQKIRQDEMVRNNPKLATQAMIDSYRKQGINAMRSDAEIIADIEQQVVSGRSLGEALTQLNKTYQSKEEYKAMMAGQIQKWNPTEYKEIGGQLYKIQNGQLSDTGISTQAEKYQHINLGNGKVGVFNPRTGEVQMMGENISQGVGTLSAKRLNAQDGEYVGVQCGQFAREAVGMSAVPGGNNLSARKKEFHEKTPKVGGMVLFAGGGYDTTYGHIAVVESINDDGSINIVESNLRNDKRVSRRTIPMNAVGLYGFYNNTPLAKSMMNTSDKEITTLKDVRLPAKTSESSKKSYSFGVRMYDSNNIIEQLEEKFVNKNFLQQGWDKYAPSFLQSAEAQQWEQARRDFINAVLRKESGAAIGKDEFENAEKQYFAQPGDTQEVIAQKRANRENAIRGMFVDVGVDENGTQLVDIWKNEGKGKKVGNENNNNPLQYTSYSVKASNGITYEYDPSTGEVVRNK